MKDILVLAHDDAGQQARLQTAIDLARALDCHLTCLDVAILSQPIVDVLSGIAAYEHATERNNRTQVRRQLADAHVAFDWIDASGDLAKAIADRAGLTDLVVVNRLLDESEWPNMIDVIRVLARRTTTPILAVPEGCLSYQVHGTAIVCWDGSDAATAALKDAMPLLHLAADVTIMQVATDHHIDTLPKALAYLKHHGIAARACRRDRLGPVPQEIERYLRRHMPAVAVLGAFGHNRLHEQLFGSVATHLLATSPVPLLLSHA